MPRLVVARDDQIAAVYRESWAVWGAGLSVAHYRELWDQLTRTAWGSRYAHFLVWVDDDGQLLSSLKLYRPRVRVASVESRASVLGAVFTPEARRGCGHAARMIEAAVAAARLREDHAVLLFSDIGVEYYERLGFRRLPAEEHRAAIPQAGAGDARGWRLRPATDADLCDVFEAHAAFCRGRPLAFLRDDDHWHFLLVRARRFFERLRDPGVLQRFTVAEYGGEFAGYLIAVEGNGDWQVREVGAVEGDPETMERILRAGARQARRSGLRRFYGWLPPDLAGRLADWRLERHERRRAVPMVLALDARVDPFRLCDLAAAFLPFQDQF